jgi:hypothetical protein
MVYMEAFFNRHKYGMGLEGVSPYVTACHSKLKSTTPWLKKIN